MADVIVQTREDLYPRFGLALPDKRQVYVRGDLPACVKRFVISHELYHLWDKDKWWYGGAQGEWTCRYEASDRIRCVRVYEPCAISPEVL